MKVLNEINYFYYKMALYELQTLNDRDYYNGLSYNSMLYINVIGQMEDCTVSKLAEALHVTKSAVTIKMNELVKAGAVQKVQSKEDKRVFYLRLSPNMEHLVGIYDSVFEEVEKELQKKYTGDQLELFNQILHEISEHKWRKKKDD